MEKDFIKGKATEKVFQNGGKIIKVWIPVQELNRIAKEGNVNFDIKTSKKGTLYMENDSWKPNQPNQQNNAN
jgi:hypothetical protein